MKLKWYKIKLKRFLKKTHFKRKHAVTFAESRNKTMFNKFEISKRKLTILE